MIFRDICLTASGFDQMHRVTMMHTGKCGWTARNL